MGIFDGRKRNQQSAAEKQSIHSTRERSFEFADFYAAVTASLPPIERKRKANNSRVQSRWSSATRFIPWIGTALARFGRGRFGRGTERGTSETEREGYGSREKDSVIVSLADKRDKEKERWLNQK